MQGHCAAQLLGGTIYAAVHVNTPGVVQPIALWANKFILELMVLALTNKQTKSKRKPASQPAREIPITLLV